MLVNKLVVAIRVNGQVLREHSTTSEVKDTVYVPFGSEYSVYVKNLETRRVEFDIIIDGKSATDGRKLVLNAGQEMNMERFLKNGNLEQGNRFKFIERTSAVEKHKGIGAQDGLIEIRFNFEALYNTWQTTSRRIGATGYPNTPTWSADNAATLTTTSGVGMSVDAIRAKIESGEITFTGSNTLMNAGSGAAGSAEVYTAAAVTNRATPLRGRAVPAAKDSAMLSRQVNDAGITAPGSVSDQKFQYVPWFATESQQHVMIFKLLGDVGQVPVIKPVTVKTKLKCVSCGKVNSSSAKFCTECSTGLVLV